MTVFNSRKNVNTPDFLSIYDNRELAEILNRLEASYNTTNEEQFFETLVNMSTSHDKPYHRWAKYREGYSGDLVKELIRRSNIDPRKHFVYDPMCGSGSTIIASIEEGYDALGNDVNPYAIDIGTAKITQYPDDVLGIVENFVATSLNDKVVNKWKDLSEFSTYFQDQHLGHIQQIANAISEVQNDSARKLLLIAWLMILEDVSDRKKDGNGLATRPSSVKDVWMRFVLQVKMILSDLQLHPLPVEPIRQLVLASATLAPELIEQFIKRTGKGLGAIIFSPPYANSFDYFESYKLELLCGYYTQAELIAARENSIRSYRKGYGYQLDTNLDLVDMLCQEIRAKIPQKEERTGSKDSRTRLVPNLLIGYFEDMSKILKGFSDAAPTGSYCHIVVDQSAYVGVIIPTDIVLAYIAELHGYEVQKIIRCRSARTSPQQMNLYPYLKTMLRESIVTLRKM